MFQPNQKLLASYLTAGLGAGSLAVTADAAIVTLDLSSVSGPRAPGLTGDTEISINGERLYVRSYSGPYYTYVGIAPKSSVDMNLAMTPANDGLFKFATGAIIGSDANWASDGNWSTYFDYSGTKQPVWEAGSFVGFQLNSDTTPLYGWLEVTWNGNDTFEILGGAYDDSGAPITAGQTVAAVPEPASVLGTLGLLSAGMFVRRRRLAA